MWLVDTQALGTSSIVFPCTLTGNWNWKQSSWDSNSVHPGDTRVAGCSSGSTMLVPRRESFCRSSDCCQHLGSRPADGKSLSLSHCSGLSDKIEINDLKVNATFTLRSNAMILSFLQAANAPLPWGWCWDTTHILVHFSSFCLLMLPLCSGPTCSNDTDHSAF